MRKLTAFLLAMIMCLSCFELSVFADETEQIPEADDYSEEVSEEVKEANDEYTIYEIQYILRTFGYLDANPTGVLGDLTKSAIKTFQADSGVEETGELDEDTKALIRSAGCFDAEINVKTLLYVREIPDPSSEPVDVISRSFSSYLYIHSSKDGWYHVETESGMTGFVPEKYLTKGAPVGIDGKIVDVESIANIRASADTTASVVATLDNNSPLKVIGGSGDWFKVRYGEKEGYIFKKYVSIGSEHGAATTIEDLFTAWKGSVNTSSLTVRSGPATGYSAVTTLSKGTTVSVIGSSGNWYYVELSGGKKGFVYSQYIQKGSGYSTCTVTGSSLNVRSGPGTSYSAVTTVSEGTVLTLLDDSGSWYKVRTSGGKEGYVDGQFVKLGGTSYKSPAGLTAPSGTFKQGSEGSGVVTIQKRLKELGYFSGTATGYYGSSTLAAVKSFQSNNSLSSTGTCNEKTLSVMFSSKAKSSSGGSSSSGGTGGNSGSSKGQQIADYVQQFVGRPYIRGANGPRAFDCSGLTKYVYNHFGISLPRTAYEQGYNGPGSKVTSVSNLQVGDLVFFNTVSDSDRSDHVGIYIGNNKFVHAENTSTGVVVTSFTSSYYSRNFSWGRHVV